MTTEQENSSPFKSGFVSLIGRPNVGKSTLINHLVGEKVAIVSAKPQTTRSALKGILTLPEGQMIFVDTAGIHKPRYLLSKQIVDQALYILNEVDWHLLLVDATCPPGKGDRFIVDTLGDKVKKTFLLLNKIDTMQKKEREKYLDDYRALGDFADVMLISAKHSLGFEVLLPRLLEKLPVGVPLYDEDAYTNQSERLMAAELIREQVFRRTGEEIPHATSVYIEEFKPRTENLTYISAVIVVERKSQKGVLIGKQGRKLKEIGQAARESMAAFLGTKVYLELFVKVMPDWRNQRRKLQDLGYSDQPQA